MADVVQLVVDAQIGPARPALAVDGQPVNGPVAFGDGARRVEIAVRLLRRRDLGDQVVEIGVEVGVGAEGERIGRAFDDLVDIGVVVEDAFMVARQPTGGLVEVGDAPGFFTLPKVVGDGDGAVGFQSRRPEGVVDLDGGEGHRAEAIGNAVGGSHNVDAWNLPGSGSAPRQVVGLRRGRRSWRRAMLPAHRPRRT